jgi:hypothetical protein
VRWGKCETPARGAAGVSGSAREGGTGVHRRGGGRDGEHPFCGLSTLSATGISPINDQIELIFRAGPGFSAGCVSQLFQRVARDSHAGCTRKHQRGVQMRAASGSRRAVENRYPQLWASRTETGARCGMRPPPCNDRAPRGAFLLFLTLAWCTMAGMSDPSPKAPPPMPQSPRADARRRYPR